MSHNDLAEDVSYLRTLAEQGQRAPLVGGGFLVLFGALLCVTYALHWALLTGAIGSGPGWQLGLLWASFGVAAGLGGVLVSSRLRRKPGAASMLNRIDRAVWRAAALAIMATVLGNIFAMAINGDTHAPNAIMAAGFGSYAIAMLTTAAIAEKPWLGAFGALALLVSTMLWIVRDAPWAYLAAAAASAIVLLAPGIVLVRNEPSSVS
jgi:hypothetical protein